MSDNTGVDNILEIADLFITGRNNPGIKTTYADGNLTFALTEEGIAAGYDRRTLERCKSAYRSYLQLKAQRDGAQEEHSGESSTEQSPDGAQ